MRRFAFTLTVVAVALAGCSTGGGAAGDTDPEGTGPSSSSASSTAPGSPGATADLPAAPGPPQDGTIGLTYKWPDGLRMLVSAPTDFTPSPNAATDAFPSYLEIHITIVAGRTTGFDTSNFSATVTSGGIDGKEILDPENGFVGSPAAALTPGHESSFRLGFGVNDPAHIVLTITPDDAHNTVVFTG